MADERIDIYDEHNHSIGITAMKSEAHAKGLWHRAVSIWMYTSKGELLLQLRATDKELYPNCWDISAAGHVGAGETVEEGALREIEEELGIKANINDLELIRIFPVSHRYKEITNKEFFYFYLYPFNVDPESLMLQQEEVQEVKFMHVEELEKALKEDTTKKPREYVAHGEYWTEGIEEIKKRIK